MLAVASYANIIKLNNHIFKKKYRYKTDKINLDKYQYQ